MHLQAVHPHAICAAEVCGAMIALAHTHALSTAFNLCAVLQKSVEEAVKRVVKEAGSIDVLVNNAGATCSEHMGRCMQQLDHWLAS